MPKASWQDATLAESDDTVVIEDNHYFPAESIATVHLRPSSHISNCSWKGTAHYYDVVVGDAVNANAAWYYPEPKVAAGAIKGRVAFWKGIKVET